MEVLGLDVGDYRGCITREVLSERPGLSVTAADNRQRMYRRVTGRRGLAPGVPGRPAARMGGRAMSATRPRIHYNTRVSLAHEPYVGEDGRALAGSVAALELSACSVGYNLTMEQGAAEIRRQLGLTGEGE